MTDAGRGRHGVSSAVHRLVEEAAESGKAGKVSRVSFDAGQARVGWPSHWPKDAVYPPGSYCTDRYLLVDFLGRGTFADIYEARDMLDEVMVALKVVRTTKASPAILDKCAAEARTLKVVEHPNVLRVFDAGFVAAEDVLFFTMERLVGSTLYGLIYSSRGPRMEPRAPALPLLIAARIAIGIARGVNALHEQKIFHRDIKPENLFYTRDGVLKVFDLDVAKFKSLTQLRTTQPGFTMGTALYMSPELLQDGTTSERSDIYAIGLVLFELIAGHHAFASGPDDFLAQADVIAWQAARMPPRLSKLISGVPIGFDAIIRQCVEKDPQKRFASCEELLEVLVPLERLLRKAAEEQSGPAGPELVVRVQGSVPSPKLGHATTDRAATAVPATPYEIVPAPMFEKPSPARAVVATSPPVAVKGEAVLPFAVVEGAALPPTRRSGAGAGEERVEVVSGVQPTGGRAVSGVARETAPDVAVVAHAAVVSPISSSPISSSPISSSPMAPSSMAPSSGTARLPVASSPPDRGGAEALGVGPRGTEIMRTGRVAAAGESAPVTPSGTERMARVGGGATGRPPASGSSTSRPPASGSTPPSPGSDQVKGALQVVPAHPWTRRRARGGTAKGATSSRGTVIVACTVVAVLTSLVWWTAGRLSGRATTNGAASVAAGAAMVSPPSVTATASVTAVPSVDEAPAVNEAPSVTATASAATTANAAPSVSAAASAKATPAQQQAKPAAKPTKGSGAPSVEPLFRSERDPRYKDMFEKNGAPR